MNRVVFVYVRNFVPPPKKAEALCHPTPPTPRTWPYLGEGRRSPGTKLRHLLIQICCVSDGFLARNQQIVKVWAFVYRNIPSAPVEHKCSLLFVLRWVGLEQAGSKAGGKHARHKRIATLRSVRHSVVAVAGVLTPTVPTIFRVCGRALCSAQRYYKKLFRVDANDQDLGAALKAMAHAAGEDISFVEFVLMFAAAQQRAQEMEASGLGTWTGPITNSDINRVHNPPGTAEAAGPQTMGSGTQRSGLFTRVQPS